MTVTDITSRRRTRSPHDSQYTARCIRCHNYWSFNSGPHENFIIITRWCPTCIAETMPTVWADKRKGQR